MKRPPLVPLFLAAVVTVAGCEADTPSSTDGGKDASGAQDTGVDGATPPDGGIPSDGGLDAGSPAEDTTPFAEPIDGSTHHFNATWWGYNMGKITRRGSRVYTYFVDNDKKAGDPFDFVIMMKEGDGTWQEGARLPTSRPGNILVDSKGRLHAFVFEAFDMSGNDSWGYLRHYTFPFVGDINNHLVETVVDNDGTTETVNIRAGAAVGPGDRMTVGWGLWLPDGKDQSIETYDWTPGTNEWTRSIGFTNLGHDFYYPYMLAHADGATMLSIQDDFVAPNEGNIYQIVDAFTRTGTTWSRDNLVDRTGHELAATRRALLETSDLYEDSKGVTHAIVKEF
ncbi:MAG: hypothetical protein KC416_12035, partial [Myxococcales bacterium]|nr:hypothetical protein [Myxococcales bacterium]